MSKTKVDQLGERLRRGPITEADLRQLDEYRRSFSEPYETVMNGLRELGLSPSGRAAKSTPSIVAKLNRETIRLSQIQDIAGCRVVTTGIRDQDGTVAKICERFPKTRTFDRRVSPSHGYRAVHLLVTIEGVIVEVQVRTILQHGWAELSEKAADRFGPEIKYGGGCSRSDLETWQENLEKLSVAIAETEQSQPDNGMPGIDFISLLGLWFYSALLQLPNEGGTGLSKIGD